MSFNHVGNRRFRDLIAASCEKYTSAKSRLEKSMVVHAIVEEVKKAQGRFLKQDRYTGSWYELDERQAKEKVGHAIRDATSSIDPKKKEKVTKKRISATKISLSDAIDRHNIRSDSVVSMSDDSSRSVDSCKSVPMSDDSSRSADSCKSELVWDDGMSNIEPIRHDSFEAKNSLAALHNDEFFLRSISAVLH
jgi:hypothetical protein